MHGDSTDMRESTSVFQKRTINRWSKLDKKTSVHGSIPGGSEGENHVLGFFFPDYRIFSK